MVQTKNKCRFCNSDALSLIIDFGDVALAGGFIIPERFHLEKKYPLQLYFCQNCYLLQIINRIEPEILFREYFYYSSAIGTLRNHFKQYAKEVTSRFVEPSDSTVIEIGCNDGVLLNPLYDLGVDTLIGVDPSKNVVNSIDNPAITVVNDFFTYDTAVALSDRFGKADLILANNVFAHIDDMHDITRGIQHLLKPDGVFVFEVHYIGNILEELQYDMIYHEHLYYYSLLAIDKFLKRYGLEVFDVKAIPIHAGSMRYYVRHSKELKREPVLQAVHDLRSRELEKKYDKVETFLDYAQKVERTKITLNKLLAEIKENNKSVYGYGASGRANTIIQYCDIKDLDCVIDDAPAKHGYYTPGSHFLIRSREYIDTCPPDYIIVFAWSFMDEIISKNINYLKNGGVFIAPLPSVKLISLENEKIVERLYSTS